MITVLVAAWMAFLWVLVKVGVLKKWHLWMKISPLVVFAVAQVVIMLPLNWNAPSGRVIVSVPSIKIVPSVASIVTEVNVKSWTPIKKGDVLFKLDDTSFAAAVEEIESRLIQARATLARREKLTASGTATRVELEEAQAQVAELEAKLIQAKDTLSDTVVKAPIGGIIPTGILLPGNRVAPPQPVMALLAIDHPIISLVLPQNILRNVKPDQPVEVVFDFIPGKTFTGSVDRLYLSHPDAEYQIDGESIEVPDISASEYVVTLNLDMHGLKVPPGSTGQGAVFTGNTPQTEFIRRLMLRMTTWLNYF